MSDLYFFCKIEIRVALSISQGRRDILDSKSLGESNSAIRLKKYDLQEKLFAKTCSPEKGRILALKWDFSGCKKHLASWRVGVTWRICFHDLCRSFRSIGPVVIEQSHFPWRENRSKLAPNWPKWPIFAMFVPANPWSRAFSNLAWRP